MKNHVSVAACAVLALSAATVNLSAIPTVELGVVEVNSIGDDISQSGIDEGILNKKISSGPLTGKKVADAPYQINTISKEALDNQGVQGFEDAVKFFPSAQIQYRGGAEVGRPQTRGFEGSVVGNVLWDGFYAVSTTAIPMAMFESLQIQNGLAGSLYGIQNPAGIFSYSRKRPISSQNILWADYVSRANLGAGFDTSDKFEKFGYRGVFYSSGGAKGPSDSTYSRTLASIAFDFYLTDNLTLETNYSYYRNKDKGLPGAFVLPVTNGTADFAVPSSVKSDKKGLGQKFAGNTLTTHTTSTKFRYAPSDIWYFEGGYQWQRATRDMFSISNQFVNANGDFDVYHNGGNGRGGTFETQSWFAKTLGSFETGSVRHELGAAVNGYRWTVFYPVIRPTEPLLGRSSLYAPKVFNGSPAQKGSGKRKRFYNDMSNIALADEVRFNDRFSILLSASQSHFKLTEINNGVKTRPYSKSGLSYAASIIYKPAENLSLYATYANSLKDDEGYYDDNFDIHYMKPFRSKQYEIGAKARAGELDLQVAIFKMKRPIAYIGDDGIYARQGDQVNYGLDFTAGGKLTQSLSVYGGAALLKAKLKNTKLRLAENSYVIGEPKIQSNLLLDYAVPGTDKLALSANFHYTGKRYADNANQNSVSGYFTTDLGARYTAKNWLGKETTLRFNVNNVFDKKYWAGMFPADVDGQSSRRGTWLFLGQSRIFMLSAQVKF